MGKLFGTDGVRGIANVELTPMLAYHLGRVGAYQLARGRSQPCATIVVGRDTRISGTMLEGALSAGICSVGGNIYHAGVVPTPAVAHLVRAKKADAGIMISASHNPMEDNGIKFFSDTGHKLPDAVEAEIETMVLSQWGAEKDPLPRPIGPHVGVSQTLINGTEEYVAFVKKSIDTNFQGVKVVVDCANGAAYKATPRALMELGAEVIAINDQPNGCNINDQCGSTHPEQLQRKVLEVGAHVGIAHDGDADRMLAVDEKGRLIDGDQIMVICANALKTENRLRNNALVVTVMSNIGLHFAMKKAGIHVWETKVGDRYVLEKMQATDTILGGEQSGHIIFSDYNSTGDGLITALQLLQAMVKSGLPVSTLAAQMEIFPQVLINVQIQNKDKVMGDPTFIQRVTQAEQRMAGEGKVLVRASGTEPLLRVMVEGFDSKEIQRMAEELADYAKKLDAGV